MAARPAKASYELDEGVTESLRALAYLVPLVNILKRIIRYGASGKDSFGIVKLGAMCV
jgi:hypothetical protein